ncbi:hypothetical protein [Coxiella endosymbiont of Ornithodoros maritimus]|uniref:hypothetical protein n=1 Tax=Coxiella endosymbiont of Ornithodoros maritimus TaxID=1656172 RepID=UPI0022650D8E|nr:hypothetical protein [Coxiella endosymbiont of Ornithodoros maritimus]
MGENILLRLLKIDEGREVFFGSRVDALGKIKLPEEIQRMIFDYFIQIDHRPSLPRFISILENAFPNTQQQFFSKIMRLKCYDCLKEKIIKDDNSIDWKELSILYTLRFQFFNLSAVKEVTG